jgi:threonyl-tRNA synthetase
MIEILIRLPGEERRTSAEAGIRAVEVLKQAGIGGDRAVVAARVNGELIDLSRPLVENCSLEFIDESSPEGLEIMRHSASHVMAQAVTELVPEAKVGIGPATDTGFYYDFEVPRPFTEEDLEKFEARMRDIVRQDIPFERLEMSKADALALFRSKDEHLKVELIDEKGGDRVSCYREDGFIDFCRGPHLPSTGRIKAFRLTAVAGAYWRGDETKQMLQRIYGTAYLTEDQLEQHLKKIEEARLRDHRRLGKELDLFSIQESGGSGLIYWHPKGTVVKEIVESFWKEEHRRRGYEFVNTPHIAKDELWHRSGHYEFYKQNMYLFDIEAAEHVIKPMNCPGHILIYKSALRSYRELPVRYAELGTVYRYEKSGVLHGMVRVRGFTQDDAHIFCTPEQIVDELRGVFDLAVFMLKTFGFEQYNIYLSVWDPRHPENYCGAPEDWERAEMALVTVLDSVGVSYKREEGEAAFYGPKIDIKLLDALGREWQATTIQFDFNLPERLDVSYIGPDSKEHHVVMIHRAILGSIERFMGTLIEHYAGAFPVWLAPVQAVIIPISERNLTYAASVLEALRSRGFRVKVDSRNEKVGLKIRQAQLEKVPFMLVVGEREEKEGTVSIRNRFQGEMGSRPVEEFAGELSRLAEEKALRP